MMCGSASIQVCLDAGNEEPGPLGYGRRWQLAHLLGAVLVAAFANSPHRQGRRTGWRSTRQTSGPKSTRSAPAPALGAEPRGAWARHVLDAPVMCIRADEGPWATPEGLTFRAWVRTGQPRPPTREDLDYQSRPSFRRSGRADISNCA